MPSRGKAYRLENPCLHKAQAVHGFQSPKVPESQANGHDEKPVPLLSNLSSDKMWGHLCTADSQMPPKNLLEHDTMQNSPPRGAAERPRELGTICHSALVNCVVCCLILVLACCTLGVVLDADKSLEYQSSCKTVINNLATIVSSK